MAATQSTRRRARQPFSNVRRGRLPEPHSTVAVRVSHHSRGIICAHVDYCGAAEALIAAGIITGSLLGKPRDTPTLDEHGMPVRISRAPTKRRPERLKVARWLEASIEGYASAMSLPGVSELFPGGLPKPEWAPEVATSSPPPSDDLRRRSPPRLRLVVDNTIPRGYGAGDSRGSRGTPSLHLVKSDDGGAA